MLMKNMEEFRLITALIFEDALETFPRPARINTQRIFFTLWNESLPDLGEYNPIMGCNEVEYSSEQMTRINLIESTWEWLVDEGFLRQVGRALSGMEPSVVLSAKGHAVLGSAPKELLGKPNSSTIADKLKEQIQSGAWDSVKQLVTHSLSSAAILGAKAITEL